MDDILWCSTKYFESAVISKLKKNFKISKENCFTLKYLGIELPQLPEQLIKVN